MLPEQELPNILEQNNEKFTKFLNEQPQEDRKSIYIHLYNEIPKTIRNNELKKFLKILEFLHISHNNDNELGIGRMHQENYHPAQSTNFIILCCKFNRKDFLEQFLIKHSVTVLLAEPDGTFPMPTNKDEEQHNAFYYAMRNGNIKIIEMMFDHWPGKYFNVDKATAKQKMDQILSDTLAELMLKNIELPEEMFDFLNEKLIDMHFEFTESSQKAKRTKYMSNKITSTQLNARIDLVLENIAKILSDYSDGQQFDDKLLFSCRSVAKDIDILKKSLKYTYLEMPWEEIQFVIIAFVLSQTKRKEINLFYVMTLRDNTFFEHLKYFAKKLELKRPEFVKNNYQSTDIPTNMRHLVVQELRQHDEKYDRLISDFERMKDAYSIQKISDSVDLALKIQPGDPNGPLIVIRVLQSIGESLKNTLSSPNMSPETIEMFLAGMPNNIQRMLTKLRNSFSHAHELIQRHEMIETASNNKEKFIENIQIDFIKIKKVLSHVLRNKKFHLLCEILNDLTKVKTVDDLLKIAQMLELVHFDVGQFINKHTVIIEELNLREIVQDFLKMAESFAGNKKFIKQIRELSVKAEQEISLLENGACEVQTVIHCFAAMKSLINEQTVRVIRKTSKISISNIIVSQRNDSLRKIATLMLNLINSSESELYDSIKHNRIENDLDISILTAHKEKKANVDKMREITYKIYLFLGMAFNGTKSIDNLKYEVCFNDLNSSKVHRTQQNEKLMNILFDKFNQLKVLLKKSSAKTTDDLLFNALEMVLLDIISIMKHMTNKFQFNTDPSCLDNSYPILTGLRLRNYIAHKDCLFEILPINVCMFIQHNARKLLEQYKMKKFNSDKKFVIGKQNLNETLKLSTYNGNSYEIISAQKQLFTALSDGNLENVRKSLHIGGDIYAKDVKSRTALHYAVSSGNLEAVKFVLSFGLDPNCIDLNRNTPFHSSVKHSWMNIVEYFLTNCKIDASVEIDKMLYLAAEKGTTDMIKLLLKQTNGRANQNNYYRLMAVATAIQRRNLNAAIPLIEHYENIDTEQDSTYLITAAENGFLQLVEYLVEKGAKVQHVDHKGLSALHLASSMGHYEVVKFLLEKGAPANIKCKVGSTPLIYACEGNNDRIIEILLEHGADPTTVDKQYKRTALHMLCIEGHVAGVKLLLRNPKVDVNATKDDNTRPIHFAAEYGHPQIVELLIKAKALINVKTIQKVTPLHYAAFRGHFEIVKLLVANGAHLDCISETAEFLEYLSVNPLQCAAFSGHLNIIQYLVAKGADVNVQILTYATELAAMNGHSDVISYFLEKGAQITNELLSAAVKDISIFELLLKHKVDINAVDSNGFSLLHLAAERGKVNVVKQLIELGANVHAEARTEAMQTPLILAILNNQIHVVKILIMSGALKINEPMMVLVPVLVKQNKVILDILLSEEFLSQTDINKCLELCVRKGYTDMAIALLKHTDFEGQQEFGRDLLFLCVANGYKIIADKICSKGVDVNGIKLNLLHTAILADSPEMTNFLIERGANVNVRHSDGTELLHVAAFQKNSEIIKILIDNGVNVLAMDNKRRIPIELAVAYDDIKSVEYLLATKKIDINHKTSDGSQLSLLHIAAQDGLVDMTKFLCQNGADMHAKNVHDSKPIQWAARDGHIKLVEFYLENGMSVNRCADDNVSLLHSAVIYDNNTEMLKFLHKKGADLDQLAKDKSTALETAAILRNEGNFQTLLSLGAKCPSIGKTIPDSDNKIFKQLKAVRQLFKAVKENDFKEIERLAKEEHAPVNAKNDKNETVLAWASWKGFVESVEMILECDGDPNILCKDNFTALHYAAKFGYIDIVKLLLSQGATYNNKSTKGKTPIQMTENAEIAKILQTIENCFNWIKSKNIRILTELNKIKNLDTLKAILRAKNDKNETLMLAAVRNSLPFINLLEQIKQSVNGMELEAKFGELVTGERYLELKAFLQNVRQERSKLFGNDCPGNFGIDYKIATIIYKQGSFDEALRICDSLYIKLLNTLGENSNDALKTYSLKGMILFRLSRNEEALQIMTSVIEKRKELFGRNDEEYIGCLNQLALISQSMGNHEAALETFSASLEGFKKLYGKNSAHILPVENNIALSLRGLGRHEEAIELFQSVYDRRKKVLGPNHSDTLRTFQHLSVTHVMRGQSGTSLDKLESLWQKQKQSLGDSHLDTLRTQIQLGMLMLQQTKHFLALNHLNEAIPKLSRCLGPNHPEVMQYNKALEMLKFAGKTAAQPDQSVFSSRINIELNEMIDSNNLEEVRRLLDYGADINWRDSNGFSPLHFAVQKNHINIVKLLLEKLADPIQTSDKGNSPLHTAASKGHTESIEILLKYVKKNREPNFYGFINSQTKNGKMTALHVAAKGGFVNVVKVLLKNGAIFDLVNNAGFKPLYLSSNQEIIRLLAACDEVFRKEGFNIIAKMKDLKLKEDPEFIKIISSARNQENKSLMELLMNTSVQNVMEKMEMMKKLLELIQEI